MKRFTALFVLVVSIVLIGSPLWGQAPSDIVYQGRLTTDTGVPIDGTRTVDIRLLDAKTGGTELWHETHSSVSIHDGVYSIYLGDGTFQSGTQLPNLAWNQKYYLEVTIDGTTFPRAQLGTSPYANNAKRLGGLRADQYDTGEAGEHITPESIASDSIVASVGYVFPSGETQTKSVVACSSGEFLDGDENCVNPSSASSGSFLDEGDTDIGSGLHWTGSEIEVQQGGGSGLNADQVDGYEAGNDTNNIAVANGTIVKGLQADTAQNIIGSNVLHDSLTGLENNDHPQYLLQNGSDSMKGSLNMNGYDIQNADTVTLDRIQANTGDTLTVTEKMFTQDIQVNGGIRSRDIVCSAGQFNCSITGGSSSGGLEIGAGPKLTIVNSFQFNGADIQVNKDIRSTNGNKSENGPNTVGIDNNLLVKEGWRAEAGLYRANDTGVLFPDDTLQKTSPEACSSGTALNEDGCQSFTKSTASAFVDEGDTDLGAGLNWTGSEIEVQQGDGSGLNADQVDGYEAGNDTGQIPTSTGNVATGLRADTAQDVTESNVEHGGLFGLGDDDHTQYFEQDGTDAMGGNLDLGAHSIVNADTADINSLVANNWLSIGSHRSNSNEPNKATLWIDDQSDSQSSIRVASSDNYINPYRMNFNRSNGKFGFRTPKKLSFATQPNGTFEFHNSVLGSGAGHDFDFNGMIAKNFSRLETGDDDDDGNWYAFGESPGDGDFNLSRNLNDIIFKFSEDQSGTMNVSMNYNKPIHADTLTANQNSNLSIQVPLAYSDGTTQTTSPEACSSGTALNTNGCESFGTSVDHGDLNGLSDDDHPQYLEHDGTDTMSGDLEFGGHSFSNVDTGSINNRLGVGTKTPIAPLAVSDSFVVQDNGNVGIGTNTPNYRLDVEQASGGSRTLGHFNHTGSLSDDSPVGVQFGANGVGGGNFFGQLFVAPNRNVIGLGSGGGSSKLPINNGVSNAGLFVKGNNRVGIGTTSPAGRFAVGSDSFVVNDNGNVRIGQGIMNIDLRNAGLNFKTDNSVRNMYSVKENGTLKWVNVYHNDELRWENEARDSILTMNQNGDVGIGTSSPSNSLDIGALNDVNRTVRIGSSNDNYMRFRTNNSANVQSIRAGSAGSNASELAFQTANSAGNEDERMRIDENGFVGIGDGAGNPNAFLDIRAGDDPSNGAFLLSPTDNGGDEVGLSLTHHSNNEVDLHFGRNYTIDSSFQKFMTMDHNGRLGIGTTSPSVKLDVAGKCRETRGACADVAELYPSDKPISSGYLIAPDDDKKHVRKAENRSSLIGITSTEPAIVFDGDNQMIGGRNDFSDTRPPVALSGRVPVRVNLEGGTIEPGDPITLSSKPGVGQKATTSGKVVGTALESYGGDKDTILVFVNPHHYRSPSEQSRIESLERRIRQLEQESNS